MPENICQKIIAKHLVSGKMEAGAEISIRIDQTLTQDATGTMAWLQFEALNIDKVQTELSVSYVDHNTLQMGFRNPDDHRFLKSVAARYGAVYSPAGTGICHQLHLENFAKPYATLLGSDSHTPTAGGIGSLAIGAGGLSVALAMGGVAYPLTMPKVVKVELTGKLKAYASAKDIILTLLGKLTVKGGVNKVFEYSGQALENLSVPERATICNMGAELGATSSIFPSDQVTKKFLKSMGRTKDFIEVLADSEAQYDEVITLDLAEIVPMAACPHMPDKVVTVAELAKRKIKVDQINIGSCTNSSYADLSLVSSIVRNCMVQADTSISPGSRQVLRMISSSGELEDILDAGIRLLECSCGPCIGMGSSPSSRSVSVRTFNRNFEGRSGTKDASVYLVSPATAAFCALHGTFTDPDTWEKVKIRKQAKKAEVPDLHKHFVYPNPENKARQAVEILRGPNIVALEQFSAMENKLKLANVLRLGDDITTDHIMPAGAEITALRSNIPAISEHLFSRIDIDFSKRAKDILYNPNLSGSFILAGENYGQGSSREHAALAPRHLGVRLVLAKSFARIHRANLINFGILPLLFIDKADYDEIQANSIIHLDISKIKAAKKSKLSIESLKDIEVINDLTANELEIIKNGGLLRSYSQNK